MNRKQASRPKNESGSEFATRGAVANALSELNDVTEELRRVATRIGLFTLGHFAAAAVILTSTDVASDTLYRTAIGAPLLLFMAVAVFAIRHEALVRDGDLLFQEISDAFEGRQNIEKARLWGQSRLDIRLALRRFENAKLLPMFRGKNAAGLYLLANFLLLLSTGIGVRLWAA